MVIIAIVGILGVGAQSRSLDEVVNNAVDGNALLSKAGSEIQSVNGGIYRVLSLQAAKTANLNATAELNKLGKQVDLAVTDLKNYRDGWAKPEDKPKIDQLIKDVQKYKGAIDWVSQMLDIDFNSAVSFLAPFDKNYGTLRNEIATMVAAGHEMSVTQEDSAHTVATATLIVFILVALLAAGIVLGIGLVVGLKTSRSINEIAKATHDLADGNMSINIQALTRGDELNAIVQSLEVFRKTAIESRQRAEHAEEAISQIGTGLATLARGDLTYRVTAKLEGAFEKLSADFNAALDHLQETVKSVIGSASVIGQGAGEISQAADDLAPYRTTSREPRGNRRRAGRNHGHRQEIRAERPRRERRGLRCKIGRRDRRSGGR